MTDCSAISERVMTAGLIKLPRPVDVNPAPLTARGTGRLEGSGEGGGCNPPPELANTHSGPQVVTVAAELNGESVGLRP